MSSPAEPRRVLGLFDSTCLIVGVIVGVGIYQMSPDVARGAGGPAATLLLWALGGLVSLCGALGYAELATAYPQAGGDYVYLGRAYGPWAGFLFGWAQMAVVRPGDIAVLAFAFATYAGAIFDPFGDPAMTRRVYAAGAVLILTALNVVGVRAGARAQNLLTAAKVLGLLLIVFAACTAPPARPAAGPVEGLPPSLALIFVLFAYGGWNEMAYVAAEVRDPARNIGRALVLGTLTVAGLYLAITGAFLHALGYAGLASSQAAAADAVAAAAPRLGGALVAGLVCVSALGAVNGLILAGARISYAMARDHAVFRPLGVWSERRNAPVRALILQGMIALILIVALGSFLDAMLYTASVVYLFYLGTTVAVIVLRRREPDVPRPFRVPGYPFTPLAFAAACLFLIHAAVTYKPLIAAAAAALLAVGILVYALGRRRVASP